MRSGGGKCWALGELVSLLCVENEIRESYNDVLRVGRDLLENYNDVLRIGPISSRIIDVLRVGRELHDRYAP